MDGLNIDKIVESIKRAMIATQQDMESSKIRIKRIELTLKSIAMEKVGAGITLQIPILGEFKIGADLSSKSVQTTSLTLKTPKSPTRSRQELMKLDEQLKECILTLTQGVKAAVNNQPPLEMEEASVELNFILKSNSDITLLIKSGFESELSNNLKVIFEKI